MIKLNNYLIIIGGGGSYAGAEPVGQGAAEPVGPTTAAGDKREGGVAAGGEKGREGEALHGRKNEEHEETLCTTMVDAHRRRRPMPEPSTKSSIGDEPAVGSMNRRHWDERYLWIPSTTHESKVIARRSCRGSWNQLRT
jgi:hypothetical protein